jgi:hypothetical protein
MSYWPDNREISNIECTVLSKTLIKVINFISVTNKNEIFRLLKENIAW